METASATNATARGAAATLSGMRSLATTRSWVEVYFFGTHPPLSVLE
jgi:hypothetical protein